DDCGCDSDRGSDGRNPLPKVAWTNCRYCSGHGRPCPADFSRCCFLVCASTKGTKGRGENGSSSASWSGDARRVVYHEVKGEDSPL
ncbi:hypothetical protein FRC17_006467, partial [Serendipita sp. 399]